jgi:hypothetical protein
MAVVTASGGLAQPRRPAIESGIESLPAAQVTGARRSTPLRHISSFSEAALQAA